MQAAREAARGALVGIAEAAMHTASLVGRGFGVVTTLGRTRGRAWDLAERYGMRRFCLGVHACDLPALELDHDPDALKVVTEACARAVESDGANAIVLRCAGMSTWCEQIGADVGSRWSTGSPPPC